MGAAPSVSVLAAITAAVLTAGCGSTGASAPPGSAPRAHRPDARRAPGAGANPQGPAGTHVIPTPGPTGVAAAPTAVKVIRSWAEALRHGDVRGAARYFSIPSQMINGPDASGRASVITIRSPLEAEAANATLPCGAQFISADQRGRYVNALFRLTNRPGAGGGCGSGAGQTARTNFLIAGGRIVEWIRAPGDPGDNRAPAPQVPASPSPPQGAGPVI